LVLPLVCRRDPVVKLDRREHGPALTVREQAPLSHPIRQHLEHRAAVSHEPHLVIVGAWEPPAQLDGRLLSQGCDLLP
jgi:hypothetical protein